MNCTASGCPLVFDAPAGMAAHCPRHGQKYLRCPDCGQVCKSLGYARHRAMHADAANREALLCIISNTLKASPPAAPVTDNGIVSRRKGATALKGHGAPHNCILDAEASDPKTAFDYHVQLICTEEGGVFWISEWMEKDVTQRIRVRFCPVCGARAPKWS